MWGKEVWTTGLDSWVLVRAVLSKASKTDSAFVEGWWGKKTDGFHDIS